MADRILRVQVRDRSLDPAQAELWVVADAAPAGPAVELRGRLTGPRCLYAGTVEVAYPLRPLARRLDGLTGPAARVVIPEPSMWEPECPFVYHGTVELWKEGARIAEAPVRHGLRRILLGPGGLRVNGRPLSLRGRMMRSCGEDEAAALRRAGRNLLVAPAEADIWDLADERGFFVLGRLHEPSDASLALAERQAAHASCLGWLLEPPLDRWAGAPIGRLRKTGAVLGAEFAEPLDAPPPQGVAFLVAPSGAARACGRVLHLPLLMAGGGPDAPGAIGSVD